ncbi:MAG: carbohydrate ABC transporter permease [Phycisphaerales bacterium JB041]
MRHPADAIASPATPRPERNEWRAGLLFISPWMVGFVVFLLLPAAMTLFYSLTEYSVLEPPIFAGLENYAGLLRDPVFWKVLRNTLVYTAIAVPVSTVVAIGIACLLNSGVRFSAFWRAVVFLPSLVPLVASAMVWMWLFNGEFGLLNAVIDPVLGVVGAVIGRDLLAPNWLGSPAWIMPSLILMSLWSIGNAVVIYLAALQDVPAALYEAAAIDGVRPLGRFRHVTLPMISPVVLFNVIVGLIAAWQVFAVPYVLLGAAGGPDRAGYFYTTYLYDNAFSYTRMGYASAMAWVQFVVILALTGLTMLLSKRFVYYRGA